MHPLLKIESFHHSISSYLNDVCIHQVKAKETLMQLVGADWLQSNRREDDLGSRPGGIVQV